jgi:hypothetical protein
VGNVSLETVQGGLPRHGSPFLLRPSAAALAHRRHARVPRIANFFYDDNGNDNHEWHFNRHAAAPLLQRDDSKFVSLCFRQFRYDIRVQLIWPDNERVVNLNE